MTKRAREFKKEETKSPAKKRKCEHSVNDCEAKDSPPVLPLEIISSIFGYLSVKEVVNTLRLLNSETHQLIMGKHGPQLDFNDSFLWLPKTMTPQRMAFARYLEQVAKAQFEEIQIIQKEWTEDYHWAVTSTVEKEEIFKMSGPASSFSEIQYRETLLDNIHLKVIGPMIDEDIKKSSLCLYLGYGAFTRFPEKLFEEKHYKKYFNEVTELNLRCNHLKKLPEQFCECRNLEFLNLSHNKFSEFPRSICDLEKLNSLYMNSNQLKSLPKEIGNLNNLTLLNLDKNQLSDFSLPKNSFSNLHALYLGKNNFETLPYSVCHLTELRILSLNNNNISELDKSIKSLKKLRRLELSNNQLTTLPKKMSALVELSVILINGNLFEEWPEILNDLENISTLHIGYNRLQNVNLDPLKLKNLVDLKLEFNRLKTVPDTLLALEALDCVELSGNQLSKETLSRLANHLELDEDWVEKIYQSQIDTLVDIPTELELSPIKRWRPWEN